MVVDRHTMYVVEKQILHDANDLFFIRVMAFGRTQGLGQNLIDMWGPRLISHDYRMHVYSDPRDQCSLNTKKLNNKSLTSYIPSY